MVLSEFTKKTKTSTFIYDWHFFIFNLSGFGILENPQKWLKNLYKVYQNVIHFLYLLCMSLFLVDAYNVRNDVEKLNLNLCATFITYGSVFKIWSLITNLKNVLLIRKNFKENLHLGFIGRDENHGRIKDKRARQITRITKLFYFIGSPIAAIWIAFPLLDTTSKERKYCIPFPLFQDKVSPTYEMVYCLHGVLLAHFVVNIIHNDLVLFGFIIRTCEQFDILIYNLGKIKEIYPVEDFEAWVDGYKDVKVEEDDEEIGYLSWKEEKNFVSDENKIDWRKKETKKSMRQNIIHHRAILKQLGIIEETYGGQLFIQITIGALVISVVAFDVILESRKFNARLIQQLFYVSGILVNVFLMCYFGAQMEGKNEKVAEAIYDLPWYKMDVSNRRICMFMIKKTRRPAVLKARYVFTINLETYLALVKTCYNVMALVNETR